MSNLSLWRNNWNPWKEAMTLSKAMDNMFDDLPMARGDLNMAKYNFNPNCEVTEDKVAYHLKVDLPGVTKENIKIDLQDNRLVLSGERKEEKRTEEKDAKMHLSEVFYGSFMRSMTFPTAVDAEKSEAKYEGGVLNLTIPKKATPNSRQITIK